MLPFHSIMPFFWKWNRKLKPTFVALICIGVLLLLRNLAFDNSIYRSITQQQKKEYQLFSSFYRIRNRLRSPIQSAVIRLNDLVVSTVPNKTARSNDIVCQHPKLDLQTDTNKNAFYDVGSIQCFGSEIFSMENGKLKMDRSLLNGDHIKQCTYQAIERIDDNYATYAAPVGGDVNYPFNLVIQNDFIRVQCFLETKDTTQDSTRHLLSLSSQSGPKKDSAVNSKGRLHLHKKPVSNANKFIRYEGMSKQSETTNASKTSNGDKANRKRSFTNLKVHKNNLLNNALKLPRNTPPKIGNKMVRSSLKTNDDRIVSKTKHGVKDINKSPTRNKPSLLLSTGQRGERNIYQHLGNFKSRKINNSTLGISLKTAFRTSNKIYKNNHPIASMKSKFNGKFRQRLGSIFNGALSRDKNGSQLANITSQKTKKNTHLNVHYSSLKKIANNIYFRNSNNIAQHRKISNKVTYQGNKVLQQNHNYSHSKGPNRFLKSPDIIKSTQMNAKNVSGSRKKNSRISMTKQKYLLLKNRATKHIIPSSNGSPLPKIKSPSDFAEEQSLSENGESQIPQLLLLPTISKLNSLIYPENQDSPKNQDKDIVNVKFLNTLPMKSKTRSRPNDRIISKQVSSHPKIETLRPNNARARFLYTPKSKILPNTFQTITKKVKKFKKNTDREMKTQILHNFDTGDMIDSFYYDNSKETYLNLPPEEYGIYNQLPDIEQFFVQIYPKPEVFQRISETPQFVHLNTIPLNILIYGLDSLSHLSFQRKLPLSYNHLKHTLGAVIMNGYNIVGDATAAAIIPLLTGRTETELPEVRKNQLTSGFVDDYPLVWNKFRSKGYVTLFAEDCPSLGVFNLRFNGFYNAPTDHYMRPFWQAISESVLDERSINFCLGSKPKHQFTLDYVKDFFQKYDNVSKFAFAFHGELSHNDNNPIQYLDKDLLSFLQSMEKGNHLNNTLLIVMSDHGARYSNVRNTVQGKLEERLPFMSFVFPKWFQSKYSYFMKNLKGNQERLVTPFDVHEMMLDILDSARMFEPVDYSTRGLSLLQPIPLNRTCKSAGIAMHWCSCLSRYPVDPSSQLVRTSIQKIMSYIRTLLKPAKQFCAQLSLKKIFSVYLVSPNEKVLKFISSKDPDNRIANFSRQTMLDTLNYQLTFQTNPNDGLYEASVKVNLQNQNFQVFPEISRLNKYGDQPNCIKEKFPDLRKYCYCKKV